MRNDPIKSAARVLEVLELFAEQRAPLRQVDIVGRLGYPQSSTTGLLKSLVTLGYLNYHRGSRTYFPTTRVAAVGDWINHFTYGSGALMAMMQTIQAATEETVALVSQNDLFIQYLRVIVPDHEFKFPPPEGTMRLLTQSSGGLVLLSRMPDRNVTRLLRHIDRHDRTARVDPDLLIAQLHAIRASGHCYLVGIPVPEAATISMLLPDAPHGIPLALGVGGSGARVSRNRTKISEIMRDAIAVYRNSIATIPVAEVTP